MSETTTTPSTSTSASASSEGKGKGSGDKEAVSIIVIGMAGSGKTTLMQRFNSYLHEQQQPPYIINLDPAVTHLPFTANIDIRDTVDYQEVMKQFVLTFLIIDYNHSTH
jgi:GTPase SAR1 family protein